ncbi:MAG: permease-like cell division protein FtsX [Acidiferrobacterales bacterium]|nr:permease-like cell division protein FtsX [Acidiferrobacterales bacterium]
MKTYFGRHLQVLFSTLGSMTRTPVASLNTILIVAITLLLPCMLYVVVKSAQGLNENWQGRPQISIFMQQDLSDGEAQLIFDEIRLHPAISLAEFVSPSQALEEFRALSGLDSEIDFLDSNPLPASVVLMPADQYTGSQELLSLQDELSKIDGIDKIRLDLDWTDRFNAILNAFTSIATLLSALLALALILIVGNTIKLLILNRRQEIEITKLVGGTDTFVRRPFLYYGSLYGLLGGIVALILLLGAAILVKTPIARLSDLYQTQSVLYQLTALDSLVILAIGILLGWLAARWSVAQHLRSVQPK